MIEVKRYWKKKLVDRNITVEYSTEDDMIDIEIERKFKNGRTFDTSRISLHPSYIEPLHRLLTQVIKEES